MIGQTSIVAGWTVISLIWAGLTHDKHVSDENAKAKRENRVPKPDGFGWYWFKIFIAPAVVIVGLIIMAVMFNFFE